MEQNRLASSIRKCFSSAIVLLGFAGTLSAQKVLLNDLSSFKEPGSSWRIVGDATTNLEQDNVLNATNGTGVLANLPDKKNPGKDLFTNLQHGDADLELEFMMAKGSNSGVYLQGRYEIQLLDSWGVQRPTYGDNGGIYQRWDESRGKGLEGYEGHPPRQNVSLAPGLWQRLKVSFQAPRFDASGKKIENAKMLRVELNGVTIHENIELLGETRGSMGPEAAVGPLRIQGDHGPIAFRNINITNYDKPRPELTNLRYTIYKGKYEAEPEYKNLPPEAEGSSVVLTSNLSNKLENEFLIRYTGTLKVKETGEYAFNLSAPGGAGIMKLNNQVVIPVRRRSGKIQLTAGDIPFEVVYSKFVDWAKPALGLAVAGPGIREYVISDANTGGSDPVDPILIDAPSNKLLRSFMDLPGGIRVVHAVNVGSAQQVHYTYDMDRGNLVQLWRGGFLDATPMWHERGDGSSRPTGSAKHFGRPAFALARLASAQDVWVRDTAGTGFRPKGYVLDEADRPTFKYTLYGATVSDAIRVDENGKGIQRQLTLENAGSNLYLRLAQGGKIEQVSKDLYLVDDKSYYIKINNAGGATPAIRDAAGSKELIIPVQKEISYSILF